MRTTITETLPTEAGSTRVTRLSREDILGLIGLSAIVALAAFLYFTNLSALGYVNHYYTAAVKSMLQSWHNFFFVAAEPGGSVSVDKPPVGLWLQVASAAVFGVNTLGLLLPQIIAGLVSVIVVYHLVRRSFGVPAGLIAGLVQAVTPVVVATDRNNTIDSTLILTLLLAAWAFIKATESGKLRYLLLGAILVGIGFNIKMLEAFLPLPAFYTLYFLGSAERFWRKIGRLALATVLLLTISLSWAVAVDLTPASQRPYVGSSGDNSEMSLIIGYNGIERLVGMFGRRGASVGSLFSQPGSNNSGGFPQGRQGGNNGFPSGRPGGNNGFIPPQGGFSNNQRPFFGGGSPGGFGGGFAGGFGGTGRAGPLRLFTAPLSKEVSWLLPLGIFSALLLLSGTRLRWPVAPEHRALVLWGGWLLTAGIFFSIAGFFHEYYLSTMAAPLAALVGLGFVGLWQIHAKRPWLAAALLLAIAAGSLWFENRTAAAFTRSIWWQPLAIGLLAAAAILLIVTLIRRIPRVTAAGFACALAAVLVTPGIWSGLTMLNPTENLSLPSAYAGRSSQPIYAGKLNLNQNLLDYLEAHTQNTRFLMAVPSSMQGADYVIATGRPVLYMGGFMGQDRVVTGTDLARLVDSGQLRHVYWSVRGGGFGSNQSDISSWVTTHCAAVQGFDTATQNSGAPDGTGADRTGGAPFGREGMQVTLYDCNPPL